MTWQQFHFPPRRSRRGYWVAASNAGRVRLSKALVEKMGSAQRYAIGIDKSGNAIAFAPNEKAGLKILTSSLALRREFQEPPPAAATFFTRRKRHVHLRPRRSYLPDAAIRPQELTRVARLNRAPPPSRVHQNP